MLTLSLQFVIMYAASGKRQKIVRDSTRNVESLENFPGVGKIEYKPENPFNVDDQFYYRYYNATERIHGTPMEEWLRPSIFVGQLFIPSHGSLIKAWSDNSQNLENYKKSIRAIFEFCLKVGIKFWSGFIKDLTPEGETFEETQNNLDQVIETINEYQQKTGVRPLWIGVDFKENRFKNGAATNSDANTVCYAGFYVKRALDIALKLNAECFLFDGNQEGYENLATADIHREIKHFAKFLKLIVDQRDKIGYRGQLLLQTNHSNNYQKYINNVFSALTFLKHFNYDRYFKINTKMGSDFFMSNAYGSLGSVDVGNENLSCLTDIVLHVRTIIENGGIPSGGLTFYLPNMHSYVEPRELIEVYLLAIDTFGKALRLAVKLFNDSHFSKVIQTRYVTFATGWGAKFLSNDATFEECEEQVKKLQESNPPATSSKSLHWTTILQRFVETTTK